MRGEGSVLIRGLWPSDSPTRSLAHRFAGALPPPREALRRVLAEALAEPGRLRGSLAVLARNAARPEQGFEML